MYNYIADSNPDAAFALLNKNGYGNIVETQDDIPYALTNMVAVDGEPALRAILQLHPDRDVIIEDYQSSEKRRGFVGMDGETTRNCSGCHKNATGDVATQTTSIVSQTNTFILIGALAITFAIIVAAKNK